MILQLILYLPMKSTYFDSQLVIQNNMGPKGISGQDELWAIDICVHTPEKLWKMQIQ